MRWWRGKGERERKKNLPFPSLLLYLFLSRPRISFRTAVSLTLRTTKEKTGTYAGCRTPWSCVSLAINLTAYFSARLFVILRYLPSSEAFTVIHFRSVLETKRSRVHEEK